MLRFLYLSQRLIEGAHHVWIDDILPTVHPQTEQVVGVSQRHAVDGEEGPHERLRRWLPAASVAPRRCAAPRVAGYNNNNIYNLVLILTRHTLARAGLANRLF